MQKNPGDNEYDIVIYGSTPAAIAAAIQAEELGCKTLIVEPTSHIGGMTTSGLGQSDIGFRETIGGLSLDFFKLVYQHYQQEEAWKYQDKSDYKTDKNHLISDDGKMWTFEPHVAKKIFLNMLEKSNIEVIYNERLDLKNGVIKVNGAIQEIVMESGGKFKGKIFIDATYEGDLLAMAGVSYHVGRESHDTYNEELAGVLGPTVSFRQPKQFFPTEISPYDSRGNLLPTIQELPMGEVGSGDGKIQAYNFRMCLTTAKENQIPIEKPENYEPLIYELLYRYIDYRRKNNLSTSLKDFIKISPMPNLKTDINDGGHGSPFSTDCNGMNWDYPEAGYQQRDSIWQEHKDFTEGLFYFLQHDQRLPENLRIEALKYGYPKDEFEDNNYWPPQLYIREARRMVGEYILTEHDCKRDTVKENSIGIASYGPDSHHVQRIVYENGQLLNEGNFLEPHKAYEIPLGVMLPKQTECTNLIVPVCVSSSHVAFGSIRMEPVFMIMGQSAGLLAGLAIELDKSVQDVSYNKLEKLLLEKNQKIKLTHN